MVRDVCSMLADGSGIEPLDSVRDIGMQSLPARGRGAGKERLTHKLMAESKRPLRPLGARDNDSHLLRFLDDGKEFVNADLADRVQQLKAETAPYHRGGCEHPLPVLVKPIQAAADD